MNVTQAPFLVEGVLILVAMVLGWFLGRKGKPYGKVKLSFHLFFWLWFSVGYYYIAQSGMGIPVMVMGVALLVQIVTGLVMLLSKTKVASLPIVHGVSASLLLVADVVGFFFI